MKEQPRNFRLDNYGSVAYTEEVREAFKVLHEKLDTHSKSTCIRESLIFEANRKGAQIGEDVHCAYNFLQNSFKDGMIFGRHSFIFRSAICNLAASFSPS